MLQCSCVNSEDVAKTRDSVLPFNEEPFPPVIVDG